MADFTLAGFFVVQGVHVFMCIIIFFVIVRVRTIVVLSPQDDKA